MNDLSNTEDSKSYICKLIESKRKINSVLKAYNKELKQIKNSKDVPSITDIGKISLGK